MILPVLRCPECGSDTVQSLGKRNFPYPFALVAVIGVTLALLHQASSPIDYALALLRAKPALVLLLEKQ